MSSKVDLAKFEDYLISRVSPNTVRVYMFALRGWFTVLNGDKISQEAAQSYLDKLTLAGKSASTVNLRAHAIKRWFKWRGKPITLDCPTVRFPEPEYLTMAQFAKVLLVCNTSLERVLVTVLFDTAIRISELLNLTTDDIDWGSKLISVVRKGGRKEDVNISNKGLEALTDWLEAREYSTKKVFDITYQDAWITIKNVGKRVGIPLHPHIFRHTRAIMMLKSGTPPHIVQQHLGHVSIATTLNIYGKFRAADIKESIPSW